MTDKSAPRQRRSPAEIEAIIQAIIHAAGAPIGAYDIAKIATQQNCNMSPAQVYRGLNRLTEMGCVERIASWNAFVANDGARRVHLLCENCKNHHWAEKHSVHAQLQTLCDQAGFKPISQHVELNGRCASCETGQLS